MPARRELTMRQIRQMLRLAHDGVSAREIGHRLGVARTTVQDNLKRAAAAGLGARGSGISARRAPSPRRRCWRAPSPGAYDRRHWERSMTRSWRSREASWTGRSSRLRTRWRARSA